VPSVSQAGSNEMIAIDVEQNTRGFDEVPSEVVLRGQGVVRLKAGREVLFGRLTATGKGVQVMQLESVRLAAVLPRVIGECTARRPRHAGDRRVRAPRPTSRRVATSRSASLSAVGSMCSLDEAAKIALEFRPVPYSLIFGASPRRPRERSRF
jgi:hypothetical protein